MTNLTPERLAALREHAEAERPAGWLGLDPEDLIALLDAADERDKLATTIKRVRALAPVDVSDWDEDDPLTVTAADLHRALDGTEDGPAT